jgi:hypothetical protein
VLISLTAYILLGLFLRRLVGVVLRGSRHSLLAAGLMHSVFNRTNNDNGIAAALLNGELYRLGILIAGGPTHRSAGTAGRAPTAHQGLPAGTRRQSWRGGALAHQPLDIAVRVARDLIAGLRHTNREAASRRHPSDRPDGPATRRHRLGISLTPAGASWRERVGREIAGLFIDWVELRLVGSVLFTVMSGAIKGSTLDDGF